MTPAENPSITATSLPVALLLPDALKGWDTWRPPFPGEDPPSDIERAAVDIAHYSPGCNVRDRTYSTRTWLVPPIGKILPAVGIGGVLAYGTGSSSRRAVRRGPTSFAVFNDRGMVSAAVSERWVVVDAMGRPITVECEGL